MEYIKDILANYNIGNATIEKLVSFESRDGFLLLDKDDFESMQAYLKGFAVYQFLVPVITDGNSNYWCLYVDGPLKNMVCYLDHEETSLQPRFRNLSSLINTINNHPGSYDIDDFDEAFFDFPGMEISPDYLEERKIIEELDKIVSDKHSEEDIRTQSAFSIMALTSRSDIEAIIYPLLDDENMYVQERAIEMLGFHKYKPAIDKLIDLMKSAKHNGKLAAKIALNKIASA